LKSRKTLKVISIMCMVLLLSSSLLAMASCKTTTYTIGITQIVTHPALDANRQGFIDQLEEEGYIEGENTTFDYLTPEGDMTIAATIAQTFVADNVDLILAIATPSAQSCVEAIEGTDINLVFGSVTDPVAAELIDSLDSPGGNVTGISDWADIQTQIEFMLDIVPNATKIGVVYNAGEVNSVVQVDELERIAPALGLTIYDAVVAETTGLLAAVNSLVLDGVDAIWIPTDNTVVSGVEVVVGICEDEGIPLFAADVATVERGAIGGIGIDYYQLGVECGEVAARILGGENPADIPVKSVDLTDTYVNLDAALLMGVTVPQAVLDAATNIIGD